MKPAIPAIQSDPSGVLGPIKENIETITGRRGGKIAQLSGVVSIESVAAKINEVLTLLQDGKAGSAITTEEGQAPATTLTLDSLTTTTLTAGNFVGMIAFFGAASSIPGWLKTDGATYNTADYPALAEFLGEVGATFAVPDIRGEFLRVLDEGRGVDAGRLIGSAQAQDVQPHAHTAHTHTAGNVEAYTLNPISAVLTSPAGNTGSYGTTETRPRNVAYPAYIKT